MNIPSLKNHYALLALFLSPWKNEETIHRLSNFVQKENVNWGRLLYMANLHFCAPLWFASLLKDGLLPLLPLDLQTYLMHLHQANTERQDAFRKAAIEIVSILEDIDVPVILLKGVATFCDDLYQDPGARMMGDLDFLVKVQHIEQVRDVLLQHGYNEQADCFGNSSGFFNSNAPHHLPRFVKPGTSVVVEMHFQTARGQAGRVLPTDLSWANKKSITWEGLNPFVLIPTHRLLHNTVHALVPFKEYTNSIISLSHLAEFAYLVLRYRSVIEWREWLVRGAKQGLSRQFRIYLTLVNSLMGMPFPERVGQLDFPGLHVARISAAANIRANYLSGCETALETVPKRIKDVAVRIYINVFRRLNRLAWEWQNLCYIQGLRNFPLRLYCLFVLFFRRNFKNLFGIKTTYSKYKKLKFLMEKPRLR
jgi:hypothetical protein